MACSRRFAIELGDDILQAIVLEICGAALRAVNAGIVRNTARRAAIVSSGSAIELRQKQSRRFGTRKAQPICLAVLRSPAHK